MCSYGGWDGTKWLADVYVLDTSIFLAFTVVQMCFYIYDLYGFPPFLSRSMCVASCNIISHTNFLCVSSVE